ncbi:MAG TPA: 5-formyltetrahydrofolate cyclo-ligase, partial [Sphaerochaeta sp.]|nr:5-formyltetrahydrofolate cyclo-ligase [Sphaerochaeta sp.]
MNKNKEEIRRTMRKLNQTMRNVDHGAEDMATVTALLNASIFHKSDRIFAFMPLFSEVDITPVLQAALKTKRLALPRSNGDDTLTFIEVNNLDELKPGRFGILEPGA